VCVSATALGVQVVHDGSSTVLVYALHSYRSLLCIALLQDTDLSSGKHHMYYSTSMQYNSCSVYLKLMHCTA
jgi:hypothetical protein